MRMLDKFKKLLEHPVVEKLIYFFSIFKSSKSFYSIFYLLVIFTTQQGISYKYGTALSNAVRDLGEEWYFEFTASILENGSIELVILGLLLIVILALVEVNKDNDSEKKDILSGNNITLQTDNINVTKHGDNNFTQITNHKNVSHGSVYDKVIIILLIILLVIIVIELNKTKEEYHHLQQEYIEFLKNNNPRY